jgi:nucleoside-diphosphate-sugar epimerase
VIFITGSTGIVGTRLIFDLLRKGHSVRALKRKSSDLNFVQKVLGFYGGDNGKQLFEKIQWVEGDILEVSLLEKYMEGVEYVYHCAALVSYQPGDEEKLLRINQEGTANIVNAGLTAGVKKLCYFSSVAALGRKAGAELTHEKIAWDRKSNKSNYSLSKFLAEQEVWRGIAEGLPAIMVNPGIILGPSKAKQSSGMLVNILRRGSRFYPPGKAGYLDVRDVCKAAILLMDQDISGERFILNAKNLAYKELLTMAATVFENEPPKYKLRPWMLEAAWRGATLGSWLNGKKPKITRETARSAMQKNVFDNSKVIDQTGMEFLSIEESLKAIKEFYDV